MESLPWWIFSIVWLAVSAAIWGAVLTFTIRNGAAKPKAARLVFVALGVEGLQWLLRLADLMVMAFWEGSIVFQGEGPDWANPYLIYRMALQLIQAIGEIASWSLLAWAALMRPDEQSTKRYQARKELDSSP